MTFEADYPFDYDDCPHDKSFTDPDKIGMCVQCIIMNSAVAGDTLSEEEAWGYYCMVGGLQMIAKAMEDEQ